MIDHLLKNIFFANWFKNIYFKKREFSHKLNIHFEAEYYTRKVKNLVSAFGVFSKIGGEIKILDAHSIVIGNNVYIEANTFLDGRGGIIIGNDTYIERNVVLCTVNRIYTGNSIQNNHDKSLTREIIIGNNVRIGMNALICPGVHIGDGAIIYSGSIVRKDVMEGEIFTSNSEQYEMDQGFNKKELVKSNEGIGTSAEDNSDLKNHLVTPMQAKQVVFVLSTGRAGSKTLAKMFIANPLVTAFHETFYSILERISIEYLTKKINKKEARELLFRCFSKATLVKSDTIYLESDQKLVPFIDLLNEIFDQPKFIWLIRHPKTFMHSAASRGWFIEDHPEFINDSVLVDFNKKTHATRITGDLVGEYDTKTWLDLDQKAKILWYWKYWNTMIENGLKAIIKENQFILPIERIEKQKGELLTFLNIQDDENIKIKKTNSVQKRQKEKYNKEKENNYKYFEKEGINIVKAEIKRFDLYTDKI